MSLKVWNEVFYCIKCFYSWEKYFFKGSFFIQFCLFLFFDKKFKKFRKKDTGLHGMNQSTIAIWIQVMYCLKCVLAMNCTLRDPQADISRTCRPILRSASSTMIWLSSSSHSQVEFIFGCIALIQFHFQSGGWNIKLHLQHFTRPQFSVHWDSVDDGVLP